MHRNNPSTSDCNLWAKGGHGELLGFCLLSILQVLEVSIEHTLL
jgi:hypothetical protein